MIVPLLNGKAMLAAGAVTCLCCEPETGGEEFELAIRYDWAGTGQFDLDTKTTFLSEQVGWMCGSGGTYLAWLAGGSGVQDDTTQNGFERVDVRVDLARTNGQWTSSVNIGLYAGWHSGASGSGPANVFVTYNGVTSSLEITPGTQLECPSTLVATVTVYADGTFDLL